MIGDERLLTEDEIEAWDEYEQVLSRLDDLYCVKMYDRVSVIKAFPELEEALDNVRRMEIFSILKGDSPGEINE